MLPDIGSSHSDLLIASVIYRLHSMPNMYWYRFKYLNLYVDTNDEYCLRTRANAGQEIIWTKMIGTFYITGSNTQVLVLKNTH